MKLLRTILNIGSNPNRKYDLPNWWRPRLEKVPRLRCQAGHWAISWWRRQNTHYQDDRSNWSCLCEYHHEENDRHWADMWADYYASRL